MHESGTMKIEVVHDLSATPEDVLVWVSDLDQFPVWTNVLHSVEREPGSGEPEQAWKVELRGKIGPFARSKRLRMVRVPTRSPLHVRFERREVDELDHGEWRFDVQVLPIDNGEKTHLTVVFEYEGRLWSIAVERLLRDEIESSKRRLTAVVLEGRQPIDHAL